MSLQSPTRRTLLGLLTVVVAVAVSIAMYNDLPAEMVVQWSDGGTPQDTMARPLALALFPALALVLLGAFAAFPRIDPLGANVADFQTAYDAIAVLIVGFVSYVNVVVVLWNAGYDFPLVQAMVPAVAALYVAMGFLVERAERNWFVGIRTPWTLSDDTVWRRTHDLGGPLFKVAGVVALGGLVVPEYAVTFLAAPAAIAAAVLTVYSYLEYRKVRTAGATGP